MYFKKLFFLMDKIKLLKKNAELKNVKAYKKVKMNKKYVISSLRTRGKYNNTLIFLVLFFILIFISIIIFYLFKLKGKKFIPAVKPSELRIISDKKPEKYRKYEVNENNNDSKCNSLDPINIFKIRLKNGPIEICNEKNTKHICYINHEGYYNDIFANKNGSLCLMENIIIDPSKSSQTGLIYKGPVDTKYIGFPILSNGFINTKCSAKSISFNYHKIYKTYFDSWNYDYDYKKENEELEELAPGKIVFLISRNQDSPNLFHGNSEIINVISMLYLFNLSPEDVKVVFMESIQIPQDPFYDIYFNMISRGGKPIHIKNLKKKYKISKAIHVPINWDSPVFIYTDIIECKSSTIAYQLYNDLIDKYMDLKSFKDKFINDNMAFYYPNEIIKNNNMGVKFTKMVTIQWRRVWPKGRTKQQRLLGNGPSLADKLASELPNNILVRLVDTAQLDYKEQISIIRNTDYFVGIHGAGLSLGIFLPKESIYHEILKDKNIPVLALMSSLSGHKTYVDILKATSNFNDGNENVYFDEEIFVKSVLTHMKDNNFI